MKPYILSLLAALALLAAAPAHAIERNVSGQKLTVFAIDSATNLPKTGDHANITAYVSIDDGTVTALTDTTASEVSSTNAPGYYVFDLTQAETNGKKLLFSGKSSTSGVVVLGSPPTVYTHPPNVSLLAIDSNGRGQVQSGTSAGQIDLTSGAVKLQATQPGTTFATLTVTGAFSINGTGHVAQTGDTFARIGANGASLTDLPWNSAWNTEVQDAAKEALDSSGEGTWEELALKIDHIPATIDGYNLQQCLALILANAAGDIEDSDTTPTILSVDGTHARLTATVDGDGNRTVTRSVTAPE